MNDYSDEIDDSFGSAEDVAKASDSYQALPVGTYTVEISKVEVRRSKAGHTGIALVWRVIEGQHIGRLIHHWINAAHPKEEVRVIAREEWARIVKAVGLPSCTPREASRMLRRPCMIDLRKRNGDPDGRNVARPRPLSESYTSIEDEEIHF